MHGVGVIDGPGRGSNRELLATIVGRLDIKVELSGGIRDADSLAAALATGCRRVNLGTAALEDPEWTARAIAERVRLAVQGAIDVGEHELFVTVSIGYARNYTTGMEPSDLLRDADAAMYRAKQEGRARAEVFRTDQQDSAERLLKTGSDLHRAVQTVDLALGAFGAARPPVRTDARLREVDFGELTGASVDVVHDRRRSRVRGCASGGRR